MFVLGQKSNFYSEGMARMIGGGINNNESPDNRSIREIREETGLEIKLNQITRVAIVKTKAKVDGQMQIWTEIG